MRTIQDRILVKPHFEEKLSCTGIFLGQGEFTNSGEVLAIGPGRKTEKAIIPVGGFKVGDLIMFIGGAGIRTKHRRDPILVLRESDVLGVLEPVE